MKKIILILTLLPSLFFGQCIKKIDEKSIIGFKILFADQISILSTNGQLKSSDGKVRSGHSWIFNNNILTIKRLSYEYFLDFNFGVKNGKFVKTWCELNGATHKSGLHNWRKFDSRYSNLIPENGSFSTCINDYIKEKIKIWEEKGEFEKTIDFKKRVNENSRKKKVEKLKKEAIDSYKKDIINNVNSYDIVLKEYNADNETFLIKISNIEPINFPVPITKAENFKKNFNSRNFSNLDFIYANDKFIVSKITIDGFNYNLFSNE